MARAYVSGEMDARGRPSRRPVRGPEGDGGSAATAAVRRPAHTDRAVARVGTAASHRTPTAGGSAAVAPGRRRGAALQVPRRQGHPPPLRRFESVLRDGARDLDGLHLRDLRRPELDAGAGTGEQVPLGLRQTAAAGGRPAARHRLRVGHDGALRGPARRQGDRRDAVEAASRVGAEGDRRGGPVRHRGGAPLRLSRRRGDRFRRGVLDRAHRTHRRAELSGVLPLHLLEAARGRAVPQPLHHPSGQHPTREQRRAASSIATSSRTAS